jgi:mycothiol system anti-sigma-R factor
VTGEPDPCAEVSASSGIDCRKVLAEVYLYLDGQLDEEQVGTFKLHLDACSPCLAEYGIEEHVRLLVSRCCGGETAPEELRHKVMTRITTVTLTSESVVVEG